MRHPGRLALLCLFPSSTAFADLIHVPSDQPTIEAGLAVASSGDTVEVACGTYFEHDLVLPANVFLRSADQDPACVTIDAQGSGRVLYAEKISIESHVVGITLTGGFNDRGPDFERDRVADRFARKNALAPGELDRGGGAGAYVASATVTFRNCTFSSNEASVHGGGLRVEEGTVTLESCSFLTNLAGNQAGALYVGGAASVFLSGCTFGDNAARSGGAVYASGGTSLSAVGCTWSGNSAQRSSGAVHASLATVSIIGSTFFGDAAGHRGGALGLFGSDGSVSGVTFVACSSPLGSSIYVSSSSVSVTNSILALGVGDDPIACEGVGVSLSCCDVWGNAAGDFVGCLVGQQGLVGNFSADPLFCEPTLGILGLLSGSPCLPANNGCGAQIGALSQSCGPGGGGVVITSKPPGLTVSADGASYLAPVFFSWAVGSTHVIATTSPQEPTAGARHTFADWSDGGAISHQVTVPVGFTTFTASFDTDYFLTTNSSAGGTAFPPSGWHPAGATVPISATPDLDYGFGGWQGSGNGSYTGLNNPATVVMNGPIEQTAQFTFEGTYFLTMVAEDGGSVTPASGPWVAGSAVQIRAFADPGHRFTGWTGSGSGAYTGPDATALVTMNGPITQVAHFELIPSYPLTMVAGTGGTVSPPSGEYLEGTAVTITAVPDPGYAFSDWAGSGSGSYSGPDRVATVVMSGPITEVANFVEVPDQLLTMSAGVGGSVQPASGPVPYGSVIVIEAFPDSGYVFDHWTGLGVGSYGGPENPALITMLDTIVETAHFSPTVEITLATDPAGRTVVVDGVPFFAPTTFVWEVGSVHWVVVDSLIAGPPGERDRFTTWNDGLMQATRPLVAPASSRTYTAYWQSEYSLTFVDPPEGVSQPGDSWHAIGAAVEIEAVANPTFTFMDWTGTGLGSYSGPDNPATVILNEPLVQAPSFRPFGFNFSISASDTDPFVNSSPPTGNARNLHLWVTCAEEGIRALEASVASTLTVLSFTPAGGVLNVGNATEILLAVGGCPIGNQVNFLLGSWIVLDTGGELCLSESSKGVLGAVDCDVIPSVILSPRIVGFSSSAQPPCLVDDNPCFGTGPARLEGQPPTTLPTRAAFRGARPNPFAESTVLHFDLVRRSHVDVRVFNVEGRLVRVLHDGRLAAGQHGLTWDGRNARGAVVPVGLYFVRLHGGDLSATHKLVRLRGR